MPGGICYRAMSYRRQAFAVVLAVPLAVLLATVIIHAQAYPPRPPAPADALERGMALYTLHCALCHGADARGAAGPSLLRSELVLKDRQGELVGEVLQKGRPERGMPAFA